MTSKPATSATRHLGPYEIVAPLGAGGMGEVYRARDTRLGREVAIKVLPAEVAGDVDRLRRFEKEARAASSLNHPNIVTIYGVERIDSISFIVMELVVGKTFREIVAEGEVPARKLLGLAVQVSEGLARAHCAGIVHRDLKPENVMVTKDGLVKILDFGLAKLANPEQDGGLALEGHTVSAGTKPGIVMGTVAYMSPEQASGHPVDFRSDQFSLGSMLYELVTGKHPFLRASAVQTLAAIVQDEPEPIGTPLKIPAPLRWIIERLLAKEPRNRYASTEDLARELDGLRQHISEVSGSGETTLSPARNRAMFRGLAFAVIGVAACIAGGILVGRRTAKLSPPLFQRLTYRRGNIGQARFAPDGQTVVYGASWDSRPVEVFTTRLESPESRSFGILDLGLYSVSSLGEMAVYWTPERKGPWLFARMPLGGGTPRAMAEDLGPADWSPDGTQLAAIRHVDSGSQLEYPIGKVLYKGTSIWYLRVSPKGDQVAFDDHTVTTTSGAMIKVADSTGKTRTLQEVAVTGLAWSPNSREVWFSGGPRDALYALTLDGKMRLLHQSAGRLYLTDVFRDGRALVRQDSWRMGIVARLTGEPGEQDVSWMANSMIADVSADGRTLLFYDGGKGEGWEGPGGFSGVYLRRIGEPAVRLGKGNPIDLSPDEKWALSAVDGYTQLVLLPTGPGEPRALKKENLAYGGWGAFLPDGRRIVFEAREKGHEARCWVQDLEKGNRRAVTPEGSSAVAPTPDGRFVAASVQNKILLYPVDGGEPREIPFLEPGEIGEHDGESESLIQWSQDGRYLYLRKDSYRWPLKRLQIVRLDLSTGRREPWQDITPADWTGLSVGSVFLSADGKSYVYGYDRRLSDLYLVEGLR